MSQVLLTRLFGCKAITGSGHIPHKTEHDFHFGVGENGRPRWRCSYCPAVDVWGEGWGYFGNLECRKCGWAAMHAVHCSRPECAAAMVAEFGHGVAL